MRQQIVLEREDLKSLREGKPLAMKFADGQVVTIILEPGAERAGKDNGDAPKAGRRKYRSKNMPSEAEMADYKKHGGVICPVAACGNLLRGNRLNDAKGSLRRHLRTKHNVTSAAAPVGAEGMGNES